MVYISFIKITAIGLHPAITAEHLIDQIQIIN